MDTVFIETKKEFSEEDRSKAKREIDEFIKEHPKITGIGLAASLQYLDMIPFAKDEFEKKGIKVHTSSGNKAVHEAQILGCDISALTKTEKKVDAFFILSSGRFHAVQAAIESNKPVFVYDTFSIKEIRKEEIESMKKKRLGAVKRFLSSKEIGIIVSTKQGQENMKEALKIKAILEKKGKRAYLFVADTINIGELENFACQSWINTACPALTLDSTKIVNWKEVNEFFG